VVSVVHAEVTDQPLQPESLLALVRRDAHGAEVLFVGTIRDHDGGRAVESLQYEIHPTASQVLTGLADEVAAAFPEVTLAVGHRFGEVPIGEAAFVVAAGSAHRGAAFASAAQLVETVKTRTARTSGWTRHDGPVAGRRVRPAPH